MHHLIIAIWLLCVAIIAGALIYRHRQQRAQRAQSAARRPAIAVPDHKREPVITSLEEEEEFYDPIVDTSVSRAIPSKKIEPKKPEAKKPELQKSEPPANASVRAAEFFHNGIISLMLMANPEKPYAGYELLQGLLSSGLRYGKMNIFHRYQQQSLSQGKVTTAKVLFSLASVVKPGTFEMPKMGAFSTPGLFLFLQVGEQADPFTAFELMLETARQLVDDLGGEIWDDQRQLLTEETITQLRRRLADYEQALVTPDLFAEPA